ncbi:MAG TPA: hypothetical protein VJ907_08695 [Halanaerobiales bacterium]|nr:hypothetical protein [Halanaerobiales bacterium]
MPLKNNFISFLPSAKSGLSNLATNPFVRGAFSDLHSHLKNNNGSYSAAFSKANDAMSGVRTALEAVRIGISGASVITGLLDNGQMSPTNTSHSSLPFLSSSKVSPLGRNEAIYHKTRVHVGRKTAKRIKSIASGPFVEKVTKLTASSMADYQAHKYRKDLTLQCGFNEKGFSFLSEDTYFSVEDFYKLFEIKTRFQNQLENEKDGIKDIYGCVYKTFNKLKLKNRNSNCTCHIKIHLIKIYDVRTNVRSLLQEITHNSSQFVANASGRLPKDFQYTDPDIYSQTNKFSINFLTDLSCRLSQATKFRERAKIVRSWYSTLPPGSIWDFSLTCHMGRGIHLNTINDLTLDHDNFQSKILDKIKSQIDALQEDKNLRIGQKTRDAFRSAVDSIVVKRANEHPTSYVLALEYVGDRRASIQRKKDGDIFSGYSPCQIGVEFDTGLTYLVDQDDDKPLVYKTIQQDRNYEPGTPLAELFCPSRKMPFHVPYKHIGTKQNLPYKMVYDEVLGTDTPSFMEDLKQTFKNLGLDPKSVTPDDNDFNYQGPDTPAPPLEEDESEGKADQ